MASRTRVSVPELVEILEEKYGRFEYGPRFDPVSELISCVLSQHTTDAISFPTFDRLIEILPTWEQVAEASLEELTGIIQPVGLARQKARTIHACLAFMKATFGDYTLEPLREMSDSDARALLVSIPGVGEKTAAITLCFALGRDVVPVDTHVYRVCQRLGLIPATMDAGRAHAHLDAVTPRGYAYRLHMATITHGRAVCRARFPSCATCALSSRCPSQKHHGKLAR